MNKKSATKLIRKFAEAYLHPFAKTLPEMEEPRWIGILMEYEKSLSEKKGSELLLEYISLDPPKTGTEKGSMPHFIDLKDFLRNKYCSPKKTGYCPCCANTGWIYYESDRVAYRCNHKNRPLSEEACNTFDCDPQKDSPCPLGTEYYNAKEVEFAERIKQDPDYQRGAAMLKGRGKEILNPSNERTEKMERVVEPPGYDDSNIPF